MIIRSQMISFRQQIISQRNLTSYISLVRQVFDAVKVTSLNSSFNLSNIATAIRQVVLRNDCLQQKDQLLDFFFACEKYVQQNLHRMQAKNQSKNWIKIVENKIKQLKGFEHLLYISRRHKLSTGFSALFYQNPSPQYQTPQPQLDLTTIQVQQDIKIKTLYFFKWCKFIEYCNSIKKLRLKQIDDLRKSLVFNHYAVKFSYFQNWRKQAKRNIYSRNVFEKVQVNNKKKMFKSTIQSFYMLFGTILVIGLEIKRIQERLLAKVREAVEMCRVKRFFTNLQTNRTRQSSKAIRSYKDAQKNILFADKSQAQKNKYRFLYYFIEKNQISQIKSKTLNNNFQKSQQNFSFLCAKTAFSALAEHVRQTKLRIAKFQQYRKSLWLQQKFQHHDKNKRSRVNEQILSKLLQNNKMKAALSHIRYNLQINKHFQSNGPNLNQPTKSQKNGPNNLGQQINFQVDIKCILFKQIQFKKLRQHLIESMKAGKVQIFLNKLKSNLYRQRQLFKNAHLIRLTRQSQILIGLKQNSQRIQKKNNRQMGLNKIYQNNTIKRIFKSLKLYKFIKLSHQECLQTIEQKIINPKQISFAFNRIFQRKSRIQSCQMIFSRTHRLSTRIAFQRCFSSYILTLNIVKEMQRNYEIQKLKTLFDLLKKNQQFNQSKIHQIKQKVTIRLSKQRLVQNLKLEKSLTQRFACLYFVNLSIKQQSFITGLKNRKTVNIQFAQKQHKLNNFLAFSVFRTKIATFVSDQSIMQSKILSLKRFLCQTEFKSFSQSLIQISKGNKQIQDKQYCLQQFIVKNSLKQIIVNSEYQARHKKQSIDCKVMKIKCQINEKSFFKNFKFSAKQAYLQRWFEWKQKTGVFQKLAENRQHNVNCISTKKALYSLRLSSSWKSLKSNMQKQSLIIHEKQSLLKELINSSHKGSLLTITNKLKALKQTSDLFSYLRNSIKVKYFSKLMRNSLILKYSKVKQYCAIKFYARNLKLKGFKGFRIMLMRLRDKENRVKTEHQIIIKVDKALHHSRNSNQLSETINRFNCSRLNSQLPLR